MITIYCMALFNIVFDAIDEQMVLKSALATQGGSGPSGFDADDGEGR